MQALELMYTDPEVNNLMLYGIKDLHYIVDQNGFFPIRRAEFGKTRILYK